MSGRPLRIAFVAPAYWPAEAFGGPIWVMRALARELVARGHAVDVWTTTLERPGEASSRTHHGVVDGARVSYLASPLRYRWMGLTPSLAHHLARTERPDIAHIFGFRDPIGYTASRWFVRHGVPYVFEALGMFRPKLRKVLLKRVLDATLVRSLPRSAALVIATSAFERREYADAGLPPERIAVRANAVPAAPTVRSRVLRSRIGLTDEPLLLYVGRVADGKGLEMLVETLPAAADAHLAIVGPDDGHGTTRSLLALGARLGVGDRVHLLGQWPEQPLEIYADADVFALPSAHENFGMSAAEAASAGVAVVVSDRCGVAELLGPDGAVVVPYARDAVRRAVTELLSDADHRQAIASVGSARVAQYEPAAIASVQEALYERALG